MEITREEVVELMAIIALKHEIKSAVRVGKELKHHIYSDKKFVKSKLKDIANKGKIHISCRESLDDLLAQIREDHKNLYLHEWKR